MLKRIATLMLIAFIFGIAGGYLWAATAYQKEIKKLQADVKICNSAWVKQFSREHGLIEVKDERTTAHK